MMDKKLSKVFIGIICITGLFLTQCREEPAPLTETPVATEQSLDIATTPLQPTAAEMAATREPTVTVIETEMPTGTPAPTATPTEGEEAAEAAAQQYVPEYYPNEGECHKAVAEGIVTECMYQSSIQNITQPEWEQLFPETEFYFVHLVGYNPNAEYDVYESANKLVAWQNDQKYEAKSFDKLLAVNNIIITDENRELVAQSFALMTIPKYLADGIILSDGETVDIEGAFNYNYCVKAWTKLAGLELQWCYVFDDETLKVASGPFLLETGVGEDYLPSEEESPFPSLKDYRFQGE